MLARDPTSTLELLAAVMEVAVVAERETVAAATVVEVVVEATARRRR